MSPTVSVCVPAYNSASFIRATIQSVLDQTLEDLELIVVDDASTDDTAEAVAAFDDPRIRFVRNEANLGAVDNWNHAISLATGRYLKLVCGDDVLRPECLALQVAALDAHPEAVLAAGRRDVVDERGSVLLPGRGLAGLIGVVAGPRAIRAAVRSGTNPLGEPVCVLLRAETVKVVGPFHGHVPYMIDLEYWLRMLERGALVGLEETVAQFRVVSTSWSNRIAWGQSTQAIALFRSLRGRGGVRMLDVAIGSVRAAVLNVARMAAYIVLARRSHPEGPVAGDTSEEAYTRRLVRKQEARWKQLLNVQAPYRWNLRRLRPGRTLDVGCGLGRNLAHLDGNGVGVDHNAASVEVARSRGLEAYTPDEFLASPSATPHSFDSLLLAHLLEHLTPEHATKLVADHLQWVRPGGSVIVITPQERGYRSDATHVAFMDFRAVAAVLEDAGVSVGRQFSFPLPRWAGKAFIYNEFVTVGRFRDESSD